MSDRKVGPAVEPAGPELGLDARPAHADARDLVDLVRDEFALQGDVVPSDAKLLVVARVAAGYLRTSPLPYAGTVQGQLMAVQSFVGTTLGWWTRELGEYSRVATPLDIVMHQRETRMPDTTTMDMLLAMTVGLLRQRQIPADATSTHLVVADWLVALYLAGHDAW